jgi:predicted nucleic-acid-binding Zn-ribbon protein
MSMSAGEYDWLANQVSTSFPDLKCLRCGYDKFYLDTSRSKLKMQSLGGLSAIGSSHEPRYVGIVCTKCGHVEQHVVDVIEKAAKPIRRGT